MIQGGAAFRVAAPFPPLNSNFLAFAPVGRRSVFGAARPRAQNPRFAPDESVAVRGPDREAGAGLTHGCEDFDELLLRIGLIEEGDAAVVLEAFAQMRLFIATGNDDG